MNPTKRHRALSPCGCILITLGTLVLAPTVVLLAVHRARNRPVAIVVPTPALPSPNARDDFLRAVALVPKNRPDFPNSSPSPMPETLASYEPAARAIEPALRALRPGLRHDYGEPPIRSIVGAGTPFPEFARFRQVARDLQGMSRCRQMQGRMGVSCEWALDGVEMGVLVQHGSVISYLVGQAIQAIALTQLVRVIPHLSASDLAIATRRMERIHARRVRLQDIIQEDGYEQAAIMTAIFDGASRQSLIQQWNAYQGAVSQQGGFGPTPRVDPWRVAKLMLADKRALILDDLGRHKRLVASAGPVFGGKPVIPASRLAQMMGYGCSCDRLPELDASARSIWVLARVEVALRRCRAERGRYPVGLAELAPRYLPSVPIDPCGGAPLRYRHLADGACFELFSIGTDLRDDGGRPAYIPGANQSGDFVAGKLWKWQRAKP